MNSYWAEHQARGHISELRADARGGQKVRQATPPKASKASGAVPALSRALARAVAFVKAIAVRSSRHVTQAR
jgi:hypothetical protein